MAEAPRRQAVGSPEAGEFNNPNPEYVPGSESECEHDDMCELWDELKPSPGPPMSISDYDWDKERHPSLSWCTANLERMSLGADGDAPACIEAKKKEALAKRNVKRAKRTKRERVLGQTSKWVEKCYDVNKVLDKGLGLKKPKVIRIWATCKLCSCKNPDAKAYGVKTKITNCPLWIGCVKHVQNMHFLRTPREIDEAVANPKAPWDNLKDRKARLGGVESRLQGQSTLDECAEEYRHGSAERKRCVVNLGQLCAVENLPLDIGTRVGFVKYMRKWEPQWPSISKQSVTRSVEVQSEELMKDIRREMEGVAAEMDKAFTTDFWTSPTRESFMTMSVHWVTQDWRLKTRILGMMNFPQVHTVASISNKLLDLRLEIGVSPRRSDGRPLQSLHAVRAEKLV